MNVHRELEILFGRKPKQPIHPPQRTADVLPKKREPRERTPIQQERKSR